MQEPQKFCAEGFWEYTIDGTTYRVSTIFNPTATGNVVDKIKRLIQREAVENTGE